MRLCEHASVLSAALIKACNEHGVPNSFSFGELQSMYGGPRPLVAGKAVEFVSFVDTDAGRVYVESVEDGRVYLILPNKL